ncbi:MAG TPA: hypothetical protein DEA27_01960 [Candidatus Moranbacteria bacterium]|nr:hypothetical protein [Candidatus Moranbacteria bacterium]
MKKSNLKLLIKLNIIFFIFYILFQLLGKLDYFFAFHFLHSLIKFIAILVLFGINSTILIKLFFNKDFNFWEFISISSAISLLLPPLLITIEFSEIKILSPELPAINSFIIFLITTLAYYLKNKDVENKLDFKIERFNKKIITSLFSSTFFWILLFYISLTTIIFLTYYALSDLDPFYWMQRYSEEFAAKSVTKISSDRYLFSSLIYILNQGSDIGMYTVFKYILPLLSLVILIPASLVANKYPQKITQILILLTPLISSSTILYLQTPIPQAIAIILIFYFFFFLIYSWLFKKSFFYYLSGIIVLLGSSYHEMLAIAFTVWILVTIFFNIKNIVTFILKNRLTTLIVIFFITSNIPFIKNQAIFISYWVKLVLKYSFSAKFNFIFPAYYVNMNGQSMGWEGFIGVSKYYLYYIGPALIFLILFFVYLFIKNKVLRKHFYSLKTEKEFIILTLCFLIFFSISEILPRLLNFALLPERAWVFTGIFSLTFLFVMLNVLKNDFKYVYFLLIFLIFISVGGALYINNLKKYIITSAKIQSTEWINKNLPTNRLFFTDLDRNLLKYYGKSEVQKVPTEFFFNNLVATEIINKNIPDKSISKKDYSSYIESIKKNANELIIKNPYTEKELFVTMLKENIQQSNALLSLLNLEANNDAYEPALYIYYAKPNKLNPYLNRPYYKENSINKNDLIFDQYPEKFIRIYEDKKNDIVIWKIL